MPARDLPARPNLEQYRKQAKELLQRHRAGDADATSRVREHHPQFRTATGPPRAFRLSDAQWVIAREHGFGGWQQFVRHIEGSRPGEPVPSEAASSVTLPIDAPEVNLCVFLEDGTRVVTAAQADPVRLWDTATRTCVRVYDHFSHHAWAIRAVDDGRSLLIGCRDGAVRIVGTESGDVSRVLVGHQAMVRCLDASPDMNRVISGCAGRDLALRVWDVEAERCVQVLDGHQDGIYAVAFDADQRRALSGSRDTTVRVWDLERGECVKVLEGHTSHVHATAWAADGERALSCSRDIRLWDVPSGRCLRVFTGHEDTIRSVAWSPDQRRALSAAHDATVRVWEVESGKCLQVLTGHSTGAINAVWSADGRRAISCDWNGELRGWQID